MENEQKQETDIIAQFRQIATTRRNEINERERKEKEERRNLAKRLVDAAIHYMATKKQTRAAISRYQRDMDGASQGQKEWTYGINEEYEVVVSDRERFIMDRESSTIINLMRDIAIEYNIRDFVEICAYLDTCDNEYWIVVEMI